MYYLKMMESISIQACKLSLSLSYIYFLCMYMGEHQCGYLHIHNNINKLVSVHTYKKQRKQKKFSLVFSFLFFVEGGGECDQTYSVCKNVYSVACDLLDLHVSFYDQHACATEKYKIMKDYQQQEA